MEFVLNFKQPLSTMERDADPVTGPPALREWMQYMQAMSEAGIMRGGNRLGPPHMATTVQVRNGKRQVQDGPFADTKELLGGYVVIDVASLDEAMRWAERAPSSLDGSTEVWPVMVMAR
jgi:hypothetical protein